MWKVISTTLNSSHHLRSSWIKYSFQGKKYFLSEAYKCEEAWKSRLQSPILQNMKLDDMFYALDHKFQQEGKASAIDVDLFANAIIDDSHVDELADVLHKLRLSPNTVNMFPSTSHALIRLLVELENDEQLIQILNDRINYGIFPDEYCTNLLLNTYIKNENFTAAAQVSAVQMLQENWTDQITSHLALYSCHMYLKNPEQWDSTENVVDDDTEEVKVRVKFIRNPYFDDHFDLRDPNLLVGKTLASLCETMSDSVGCTYRLVGLALYQKWDKILSLLQHYLDKKQIIFKEGITMLNAIIEKQPTEAGAFQVTKDAVSGLLSQLASSGLLSDSDFQIAVFSKVEEKVKNLEEDAIKAQKVIYENWERDRMEALQQQMELLKRHQRLTRVDEEKKMLLQKEEELFFFDNEDKWDLVIDSKKVFQPKRYFGKMKKRKVKDEDYVPPQI